VKKRQSVANGVDIRGKLGGKKTDAHFHTVGPVMEVALYRNAKKRRAVKARRAVARAITPRLSGRQVRAINDVLGTRQGGQTVPLPVAIPTRRFTSPDGTASATVPDLPGWSFFGGDGVISGGHPDYGAVNLGVPVYVGFPGFTGTGVVSPLVLPDQAIFQVWPQHNRVALGRQPQVLDVKEVPNTRGWLGLGFDSALYTVLFSLDGRRFEALMISGVGGTGTNFAWLWYYSYVAVVQGAPAGVGDALLNVWKTWSNEAAVQRRLDDARFAIATTPFVGAIDPDVFERVAQDWNALIRQ